VNRLVYLKIGLGVVLAYVGVKMLIVKWVHIPALASLGVITGILTLAAVASLRKTRRDEREARELQAEARARAEAQKEPGPDRPTTPVTH
jgi:predicted tellurium resistance membrane protein TerC